MNIPPNNMQDICKLPIRQQDLRVIVLGGKGMGKSTIAHLLTTMLQGVLGTKRVTHELDTEPHEFAQTQYKRIGALLGRDAKIDVFTADLNQKGQVKGGVPQDIHLDTEPDALHKIADCLVGISYDQCSTAEKLIARVLADKGVVKISEKMNDAIRWKRPTQS